LTNRAEFQGSTPLQGASAFLIKTQDGRTLAATAKHLIGQNGGVEPEVSVAAFDGAIQSWRLFPRTLPDQLAEAGKVAADGLDDPRLDWLILTLKDTGKPLPATPMRLRLRPAEVGEEVYFLKPTSACRADRMEPSTPGRAHGGRTEQKEKER
jgi:hypothetical protein